MSILSICMHHIVPRYTGKQITVYSSRDRVSGADVGLELLTSNMEHCSLAPTAQSSLHSCPSATSHYSLPSTC